MSALPEARSNQQPPPSPGTGRLGELDALRGLLFLIMVFNHWPSEWKRFTDQPLGFVSMAELFVFISAWLVGARSLKCETPRDNTVWLLKRAWLLYRFHLLTLAFAFVVFGQFLIEFTPYRNIAWGFYREPALALLSSTLLLYQPPLLDILPTYIIALLLSPVLFWSARRLGWGITLGLSGFVWGLSQFGLRQGFIDLFSPLFFVDPGAFDDFAWQFLWCCGIYCGSGGWRQQWSHQVRTIVLCCVPVALVFFIGKAGGFNPYRVLGDFAWTFDKWHLGPFRVLNIFALVGFYILVRPWVAPALAKARFLSLLGRNALPLFAVHACIALVGAGMIELFSFKLPQIGVLHLIQFTLLITLAAYSEHRRKQIDARR